MDRFLHYLEHILEHQLSSRRLLLFVVIVLAVITVLTTSLLVMQKQSFVGKAATVSYTASTTDFPNPERGFFTNYITTNVGNPVSPALLQNARAKNMTLVRRIYVISDFRDKPLSQEFLNYVAGDMAIARENGVKYILRFAYNFDTNGLDAAQTRILEHAAQLKPVLTGNADVIAHIEAGFVGKWGEWHGSSNGLTTTPAMTAIVNGLLDMLSKERAVQLRYNYHKRAIFGNAPLTSQEAFSGSSKARVGHHNDCFLASTDDMGTYFDPMPIEQQKDYLNQENQFVPQSGETCRNDPQFTSCSNAVADLRRMRWSSLNNDFDTSVLNGWVSGGCMSDIQKQLGYRFRLVTAAIPDPIKPGGVFSINANIANDGYASPYNPRKLEIILRNQATRTEYLLSTADDPRRWLGGTTNILSVTSGIPAGMPEGNYDVFLNLPDPQPNLYDKPAYAIQLANQNVWEETSGYNSLQKHITINASAGGENYTGTLFFVPKDGSVAPTIHPTTQRPTIVPSFVCLGPCLPTVIAATPTVSPIKPSFSPFPTVPQSTQNPTPVVQTTIVPTPTVPKASINPPLRNDSETGRLFSFFVRLINLILEFFRSFIR